MNAIIRICTLFFFLFDVKTGLADCNVRSLTGIEIVKDTLADIRFKEVRPRFFEISYDQYSKIDKNLKIADYRGQVNSQLPADHCGTEVILLSTQEEIEGSNWILTSGVRTHRYICAKTSNMTCCKGLKCKKCDWVWRDENLGVRKTLDLTTRLMPSFTVINEAPDYAANVVVNVDNQMENLQKWEENVLNILKNITGIMQIGSFNIINFSQFFDISIPVIPGFELFRERFIEIPNFRPRVSDVKFANSPHGFALQISAREERKCAVAETIYDYFRNLKIIKMHNTDNESAYTVMNGDTL